MKVIAGNQTIESLDIGDTQVTDVGLLSLRKSRTLRHLNVSGTRVSEAGLQQLKRAQKDLDIDYLYGPRPADA